MSLKYVALLAVLASSQQVSAQTSPSPPASTDGPDIVVNGRIDPEEPDTTNSRPMVIVVSRIPHRSLQNNPNIASATSLGGLTADSGVDAWQSVRTKRWKTCRVTGAVIGKSTACALVKVQKAMDTGHFIEAEALALPLASNPGLTVEERYVIQEFLYRIAVEIPDVDRRRRSLAAMVDTGLMPPTAERSAIGTLASLALKSNDIVEAIDWYRMLATIDPDDTQSRINAGVLLTRIGRPEEGKIQFREAIAVVRREGHPIPATWIENAR